MARQLEFVRQQEITKQCAEAKAYKVQMEEQARHQQMAVYYQQQTARGSYMQTQQHGWQQQHLANVTALAAGSSS